jgi:hypothetical protein
LESKTKLPYWAVGRKNYISVGKSLFEWVDIIGGGNMSMPNFNTMRNFPLYVRDFVSEVDYCPVCNTYGEDGVCPICGAATKRKAYLDEVAAFEFVE